MWAGDQKPFYWSGLMAIGCNGKENASIGEKAHAICEQGETCMHYVKIFAFT